MKKYKGLHTMQYRFDQPSQNKKSNSTLQFFRISIGCYFCSYNMNMPYLPLYISIASLFSFCTLSFVLTLCSLLDKCLLKILKILDKYLPPTNT